MNALVLLNGHAGHGTAARKWQAVALRVSQALGGAPSVHDHTSDWGSVLREALRDGPCVVVAAGGDGTVHKVMNLLLELPPEARERAILGAVGLGSSNDFHKPATTDAPLRGIPLRGAVAGATFPNILRVAYEDGRGRSRLEHALTSCSFGLVALGNELYNSRSASIRVCRRLGPSAGIWAASLAAVSTFRASSVTLHVDGVRVYEGEVCLIGFYLSRHFAGSLKYPPVADGAGSRMGVVVLPKVTRGKCLRLLARAAGAGLPGPPETQLWTAGECRVTCEEPQPMEMDGEVVRAGTVTVRLVASTVRVCA